MRPLLLVATLIGLASVGCDAGPRIGQGTLQVDVTGVAPAAASVRVVVTGPRSVQLDVATSGAQATLQFELIEPGSYRVEASSFFAAGQHLQTAAASTAQVEAGRRATVAIALGAAAWPDAGALADAAASDRSAQPEASIDHVSTDQVSADATDAGAGGGDAAGEDRGSFDAAGAGVRGVLAAGFPVLWAGGVDDHDQGYALALDDAVWVAGSSFDSSASEHLALWKYDRAGGLAAGFPRVHVGAAGGGGPDYGVAIAIDRAQQVVVAGCSRSIAGDEDLALWKFDNGGALASGFPVAASDSVNACGPSAARLLGIQVGASDDIWVAGRTTNGAGNADFALWHFDASGVLQHGFPVVRAGDAGGADRDFGAAIAVDANGDLWIAGESADGRGIPNLALWKFDTSGVLANGFPRTWIDAGLEQAAGYALVFDGNGDLWVGGKVRTAGWTTDAAIWKFSAAGELAPGFPATYDGPAAHHDDVSGLAFDADGRLWAVGRSTNFGGNYDLALWLVDGDGRFADGFPITRDGDTGISSNESVGNLVFDPAGALWAAGSSFNRDVNRDLVVWKFE